MISEMSYPSGQTNEDKEFKISVIVPTYNERDSLLQFIAELRSVLDGSIGYEIIVVDDNSPDGTGKLADELSNKNNDIRVVHRPEKMGLASAIVEGFVISRGEFVLVSDADLQHSPALLKTFLEEADRGADLVIASRYITGANINGWSPWRKVVSRGATLLAHVFLPKIRRFKDPLSGYFMFKRKFLMTTQLSGLGWKILMEILVNGRFERVVEVPYIFRSRINGKSKLKLRDYLDYLMLISLLRKQVVK